MNKINKQGIETPNNDNNIPPKNTIFPIEKIAKLQNTIDILLKNAHENEKISRHIRQIVMQILKCQNITEIIKSCSNELAKIKNIDVVEWFCDEESKKSVKLCQQLDFKSDTKLQQIMTDKKIYHGRGSQNLSDVLFNKKPVKSQLIVPVYNKNKNYIMAIGSLDELFFHPEKDIFLLEHLQDIMNFKFNSL
jgi:uncharacterized protein YigA (DUF484 family)